MLWQKIKAALGFGSKQDVNVKSNQQPNKQSDVKILPVGDSALLVEFGRKVDDSLNDKVRALADALSEQNFAWLEDLVPAFASLLVCYDPAEISFADVSITLGKVLADMPALAEGERRIWELPVCYEDDFAPDMADMEKLTGFSAAEIIKIHSGRDYKIHMLGFLPGFAYLGGLDERIAAARLDSPRVRIEPGSVGIGGSQTGIYPLASPGGWRLIGKTPVDLYDPKREEPIFYQAGDYIRFRPISAVEFAKLRKKVEQGKWQPRLCADEEGK
jgi:KipI family sensor histidine kinase inhibitor